MTSIDCSNSRSIKKGFEELTSSNIITETFLNEIKDVLSISDKEEINLDDVIKTESDTERLRNSIEKGVIRKVSWYKKSILKILEHIPIFTNEKYIKSKLWFDYRLLELLSYDTDEIELFWKSYIFKDLFDIMHHLSPEEIGILWDICSEKYNELIKKICLKFLDSTVASLFLNEPRFLDDDFIKNLKEELGQKYPNVWSSNFMSIGVSKKTEQKFTETIIWYITTKIENYIKTNKDKYSDAWSFIKDFFVFFNNLLNNWFDKEYHDFMYYYMHNLYKEIDIRKTWSLKKQVLAASKKIQEDRMKKESLPSQENKENKCPQKVVDFLNDFIDSIDVLHKEKFSIRSYILRLHLKWKSIRIKDMIQNFPATKDLFTEEFINQAKEIWLIFENWIHKKNIEDVSQSQTDNTSEKINEPEIQIEDEVKIAFEKKIDFFTKNTKVFDGNGFSELMKLSWYKIENSRYLAKTFDKLYKKDCNMKLLLLNDIKQNIYSQEKISHVKECYRKINLHNSYRILFLINSKTIDWIYNHTDYEKRIDSKVF